MSTRKLWISAVVVTLLAAPAVLHAQVPLGTEFTYQGQLNEAGVPIDGLTDFEFRLWDAESGGNQIGWPATVREVNVVNGLFTVQLDFGSSAFEGDACWLEITVTYPSGSGVPTTLSPRQPLTAAPYALYALSSPGDWQTAEGGISFMDGAVGIGTDMPELDLHVFNDLSGLRAPGGASLGSSVLDPLGNFKFFYMFSTDNGHHLVWDDTSVLTFYKQDTLYSFLQTEILRVEMGPTNKIGIGTQAPDAKLHVVHGWTSFPALQVEGGGDASLTNPGPLVVGSPAGANIGIDTNEIMARDDGATSTLYLNHNGGDVAISAAGDGRVGIGTSTPSARLHVSASQSDLGIYATSSGTGVTAWFNRNNPSGAQALFVSSNSNVAAATTITNTGTGLGLHVVGTARVAVLEIEGADLAEKFPASEEVRPAMVVAIDPRHPGKLCLARGAYNRRVAGVVSGANDLPAGAVLGHLPGNDNAPAIALSGRVWVYCDVTERPIEPGDLLTTSNVPGHAMKVTDYTKAQGAIIGKAMTRLEKGETGLVLVLVSLQ
ncbi:MAG: hypothetical protein ACE5I3_02215 [Phycisphaerae bacterium]